MRAGRSRRTIAHVMSDAGLVVVAVVGLVLTAGAILRDTRHRIGLLRFSRSR
jgi:hypothetical protein